MKKAILIAIAVSLSIVTMAQTKTPVQVNSGSTTWKPAPDKKFNVEFTAAEFQFFMSCAQYGFQPYVKTTTIPMNQAETLQQSYTQVLKDKFDQFKKQYVADSLQAARKH